MPGRPRQIPAYCLHKASGQAVVRINGRDEYLGKYDSQESWERYHRLVAERFPNGPRSVPVRPPSSHQGGISVVELIAAYWQHVEVYYRKNGKPTSEQTSLRCAFRPLKDLYGRESCCNFGSLALDCVRNRMIEQGLTRKRINQHIGRIRRMFKWAAAKEMLPVVVYQGLMTLEGLRKGRSNAKESIPIRPVPAEHIAAVLPYLTPPLQAMVRLQSKIGCRPEEITILRPCDIDQTVLPWIYTPASHKTEHHEIARQIPIGFEGRKILEPYLTRRAEAYCFSPKEGREAFDAERRCSRRTPLAASSLRRIRKANPKKKPGERYTTASYDCAIARACKKAGVPHWHPNQLRHNVATEVRKKFGLEGSQVILGHSSASITQIYAERDLGFAKQIMNEIG